MLRTEQKEQAVTLLNKLNIYKPYINGFKKSDKVCFFEHFAGFWINQEPEIESKMKEIEKEYNCLVYAVTHELTEMGEMYSFLIVPESKADWHDLVEYGYGDNFYAFAYVWNKTDDFLSEFGTVTLRSFGGGIRRVG